MEDLSSLGCREGSRQAKTRGCNLNYVRVSNGSIDHREHRDFSPSVLPVVTNYTSPQPEL